LFEIGSSLREARTRRKLELSHVERDTRIRAKYLRALEDERFDVLPGAAYTKGFLRTYADYLDLDAQRFVDEYNTRFAPEQELDAPAPVRIRRRRFTPVAPPTHARSATASRIVLVASRGPCWLSVHISSAAGQTVFERTLQPSQTARFTLAHRHLWMRIGAPWNLDATLNGKPIQLPAATGDVVVTPTGLR
jgi:hypothetical protein